MTYPVIESIEVVTDTGLRRTRLRLPLGTSIDDRRVVAFSLAPWMRSTAPRPAFVSSFWYQLLYLSVSSPSYTSNK